MVAVVKFFCILKNLYFLFELLHAFQQCFIKIRNLFWNFRIFSGKLKVVRWVVFLGNFIDVSSFLVVPGLFWGCNYASAPPASPPPSPLHWRQILKHYTYSMRYIEET